MTDVRAMVRVRGISGQVLATEPTDSLRDVRAVKRHLRTLYHYPVCLQELLQDERVLEDSDLVDESVDLQLVVLSRFRPEQMREAGRELVEYTAKMLGEQMNLKTGVITTVVFPFQVYEP